MKHIMLDLETLSTQPDAIVVSIGAFKFEFSEEVLTAARSVLYQGDEWRYKAMLDMGKRFYLKLDLREQERRGRHMSVDTVLWWMKQSGMAQTEVQDVVGRVHVARALAEFEQFVLGPCGDDQVCVWGNGSDFDNVILANLYQQYFVQLPWTFYKNRCFRTVKNIFKNVQKPKFVGIPHNAADDAVNQAFHLLRIVDAYPSLAGELQK